MEGAKELYDSTDRKGEESRNRNGDFIGEKLPTLACPTSACMHSVFPTVPGVHVSVDRDAMEQRPSSVMTAIQGVDCRVLQSQ